MQLGFIDNSPQRPTRPIAELGNLFITKNTPATLD
jgi:hypothetical protein